MKKIILLSLIFSLLILATVIFLADFTESSFRVYVLTHNIHQWPISFFKSNRETFKGAYWFISAILDGLKLFKYSIKYSLFFYVFLFLLYLSLISHFAGFLYSKLFNDVNSKKMSKLIALSVFLIFIAYKGIPILYHYINWFIANNLTPIRLIWISGILSITFLVEFIVIYFISSISFRSGCSLYEKVVVARDYLENIDKSTEDSCSNCAVELDSSTTTCPECGEELE